MANIFASIVGQPSNFKKHFILVIVFQDMCMMACLVVELQCDVVHLVQSARFVTEV